MWQQVDPTNLGQLQQVVDVFLAHEDTWADATQLQQWMEARDVRFFYFQGGGYELVVGFEHLGDSGEWRLRTGGARGNLVDASGQQMASKVVEFMQSEGLSELSMYTLARSPMDPDQVLLEQGVALLRQHPGVAEVRRRQVSIGLQYDIILQ
jgi:hypothetical protein